MTEPLNPTERAIIRGLGITEEAYRASKARVAARRAKPTKADTVAALRRMAEANSTPAERKALEHAITEIEEAQDD